MKHYYYFILPFLFSVSTSFAQTLEDDRQALVALYNATDGSNWTNKTGWNPSGVSADNPCGWFGVTCEGGRVTELNIRHNGAFGHLPAEIGKLSALKVLNLNANDPGALQGVVGIGGAIPAELGNLSNLEYLDLGGNLFTGSIPSSLGNLQKLTFLDLSYLGFDAGSDPVGELGGVIPPALGSLTNLKHLNLSNQNLSGSIPPGLGNLTALEYLNLAGNILIGSIPATFNNLVNLKLLDLHYVRSSVRGYDSYGALGGYIPDLSGIPVAAYVDISGNSFTFFGMDNNISRLDRYSNQAKIILYEGNGRIFTMNGGSHDSFTTYYLYKDDVIVDIIEVAGAMFLWRGPGTYRIEVTVREVPDLRLYTQDEYIGSVYPVTLTSFAAKKMLSSNELTWKTTSETNNKGFQIERSVDAKTFENIGFIEGIGDNDGDKTYSFLDIKPFAKTYYRLKQIDRNGKSEYSRIIDVKQDYSKFNIYPNPAKTEFFISGLDREQDVVIRNFQGRIMLEQRVSPNQPIRADKLSNGLYLLKVGEETKKVAIQNE